MNRDDDFIGRLEDYLEFFDGATPLPEGVRDAVHADLPRTRQVSPDLGTGRMLDMISRVSTRARWGLVAAAMVGAIVVGAAVFNDRGASPGIARTQATPSPVPTSTSTPTAQPTLTPLSAAPAAACVPGGPLDCTRAGTYRLSAPTWPALITLDVPAGWFLWQPAVDWEGMLVGGGRDAPSGSGWGLMFIANGAISKDPCHPAKGTFDRRQTATVDGVVTAMRSWPGFKATRADADHGRRLRWPTDRADLKPHDGGLPEPRPVDHPAGRGRRCLPDRDRGQGRAHGPVPDRGRQWDAGRHSDDRLPRDLAIRDPTGRAGRCDAPQGGPGRAAPDARIDQVRAQARSAVAFEPSRSRLPGDPMHGMARLRLSEGRRHAASRHGDDARGHRREPRTFHSPAAVLRTW